MNAAMSSYCFYIYSFNIYICNTDISLFSNIWMSKLAPQSISTSLIIRHNLWGGSAFNRTFVVRF